MSGRIMLPALVSAVAARAAYAALRARPPAGPAAWTRTNHRGEPVTLLAGPAVALGSVAGAMTTAGPARERVAMVLAAAGAAAFGGYDDLAGDRRSTGFRGHLGALAHGELTTGAVKLAGIGATGVAAALVAGRGRSPGRLGDGVINAGLVAGCANLVNLFDLRPGRAIKVTVLAGGLLATVPGGAAAASAPVAAATALLPADLGEQAMLGDAGANALGAMLGAAAATTLPRPARVGALAAIIGLTAASEFVSFTAVIDRTGPLRWLDMLGRRPPASQPVRAPRQSGATAGPGAGDRDGGRQALAARRLARTR